MPNGGAKLRHEPAGTAKQDMQVKCRLLQRFVAAACSAAATYFIYHYHYP